MRRRHKSTPADAGRVSLRAIDQETTRVVAVLNEKGVFVGAGCLLDGSHILTCYHVLETVLGAKPKNGASVRLKLIGIPEQPVVRSTLKKLGKFARDKRPINDLALLELNRKLDIPVAEFATPLRHSGKKYSVLGFPDGMEQGRNASGWLHAADALGLVQMDGSSALFVKGGFSGAPVWSPDMNAFVGMVVSELYDVGVAWCIPSRVLCSFFPNLSVRFRIPPADRPEIHDYWEDDPNLQLFGTVSDNGQRCLTVKIRKETDHYVVKATYECVGPPPARGGYVTFITYPDFRKAKVDAYELFASIKNNKATQKFWPTELFTMAAIGDAGDTALTLNLNKEYKKSGRKK
jgi:hypothetical protein